MKTLETRQSWFVRMRDGLREAHPPGPVGGRYRLLEKIGEDAAAIVHRAYDRLLHRTVAIKVLRTAVTGSETARLRLRREAELLGRLAHPHLVRLHDASKEDDGFRLVMEWVEGSTLASVLAEKRLDLRRRIELVEKAARGVAAAHAQGIVHRDLKPANIHVTTTDEPRVADFGLALFTPSERSRLTEAGTVMGTPLHMAPEQVRGDSVAATADMYAPGAITRPPPARLRMPANSCRPSSAGSSTRSLAPLEAGIPKSRDRSRP